MDDLVRDNRIKSFRFSEVISATSTAAFTGSTPINGEILEVNWAYGSQGVGSLFITESGTGTEVWRKDAASGAGTQVAFPRVLTEATTGSIAGTFTKHVPFVINNPLILNTKAILSGTTAVTVEVKYR